MKSHSHFKNLQLKYGKGFSFMLYVEKQGKKLNETRTFIFEIGNFSFFPLK